MVKATSTKTKVPEANKRRWLIGSAIIIALLVTFVGFLIWFFYIGSSREIITVADRFKPDPSWQLKSEKIEPPRTICIDVECPSVWRQWKTNEFVSYDTLRDRLTSSGLDLEIDGDCTLNPADNTEDMKVCSASGVSGEYEISVTVRSSNSSKHSLVGLNIWKE